MPNVDWDKIRAEYIAGKLSQRKLAEKYGVSNAALQKRAQREKWTALRDDAVRKASEKMVQKTANERAKAAAEVQRLGIKFLRRIETELDKMSNQPGTRVETATITPRKKKETDTEDDEALKKMFPSRLIVEHDFVRLANAYATVARTLGADTTSDRLAIDRERMQLERDKFELEHGAKDNTEEFNAGILSLADLINHPQPDRSLDEIMREDDEHA